MAAASAAPNAVQRLRFLQSVALLALQYALCLRGNEARTCDIDDFIASSSEAPVFLKRGVTKARSNRHNASSAFASSVTLWLGTGTVPPQTTDAANFDRFCIAHAGCGLGGTNRTINWECCARCRFVGCHLMRSP